MVLNWRCDRNQVVSGANSSDLRLAKTRDHIHPKGGPCASGRQQSVIGRKNDVVHDNVGLHTAGRNNCDMIQSEESGGKDCARNSATSAAVLINAPSSSDQYCRRDATERGTYKDKYFGT